MEEKHPSDSGLFFQSQKNWSFASTQADSTRLRVSGSSTMLLTLETICKISIYWIIVKLCIVISRYLGWGNHRGLCSSFSICLSVVTCSWLLQGRHLQSRLQATCTPKNKQILKKQTCSKRQFSGLHVEIELWGSVGCLSQEKQTFVLQHLQLLGCMSGAVGGGLATTN